MKAAIIVLISVSINVSAQHQIADSTTYDLALRTIQSFTKTQVQVLHSIVIPTIFWDSTNKTPKAGKYFKESDLDFISSQISNPSVTTWNTEAFTKIRNIRLVKKLKGRECLIISLPIYSKDLTTVVIYYEAWDKSFHGQERSGAGFATVWKRNSGNGWTKAKEEILWITAITTPAQNVAAVCGKVQFQK